MNTVHFPCCVLLVTGCVCAVTAETPPRELSYVDLVRRLYDLKLLAEPPVSGETSGAATSGDRASRYDAEKDLYVDWRANGDGGGCVRREGDQLVAAELEGPGVIWRIWSAQPAGGKIRFFIDGAEQPVLDVPFKTLFDAKGGPFPFPELVREMARGQNCFVPIPYQKSCKVVFGKDWGNYSQFTYTKFPKSWTVPSFRGSLNEEEKNALGEASRIWSARGLPVAGKECAVVEKELKVEAGQAVNAVVLDGPRAITGVICSVAGNETNAIERALRELTISITWDGESLPSVWSPLGDFFGSAPGINPFRALPAGMLAEGLYASWYMPFGSKAVIRLANEGPVARQVTLKVIHGPLTKPADQLLRFHAKWHRDHFGKDGVGRYAKDRWPDWPMLLAGGGRGRFCGVHLHIWNPLHVWEKEHANRYVRKVPELCPDPAWFRREFMPDAWYGEGDEKFFVDGEKYPSTFGTGTEDYFGFAWGTPKIFDSATQCQTRNTNNMGHISIVRFHVADNVPFQSSFEAAIEKYHGNNWPLLYAATLYWYQAPGVADEYTAVPLDQRVDYYAMPEIKPRPSNAAVTFECEALKVLAKSESLILSSQDMSAWGRENWGGGEHLLGRAKKAGDFVELAVPAPDARPRKLVLRTTQAPDYATLRFSVNGSAAAAFDGYAPNVQPGPGVELGTFAPKDGVFVLRVEVTGMNAAAGKGDLLFGLDRVELQK